VEHFKGLFKELDLVKMGKILKQIFVFPRFIDDEVKQDLYHAINKEEIQAVISSCRKDKSSGSDI
jgi:hypothetical protein